MVCKDTLKIKNLPKELSDAHKEDFARHFGASKVKVVTSRVKEKSVVYAKFDSEEFAKSVMFRLHQIIVLNCRLCVEYAENDILQGKPKQKRTEEPDITSKKAFKTFVNKITSFNDSVGFHQPPPAHLKYLYPKANRATINNIAHALTTIPRFYTQVLHLMNKMSLPPPFAVEQPPVRTVIPAQEPIALKLVEKVNPAPAVIERTSKPISEPETEPQLPISTSESELESDNEDTFRNREYMPLKRKATQKKVIKRPKFIKLPTVSTSTTVSKPIEKRENVFEKVDIQVAKKIEMKVSTDALIQQTAQKEEKHIFTGTGPSLKPEEKHRLIGVSSSPKPQEKHKLISVGPSSKPEVKQNKPIGVGLSSKAEESRPIYIGLSSKPEQKWSSNSISSYSKLEEKHGPIIKLPSSVELSPKTSEKLRPFTTSSSTNPGPEKPVSPKQKPAEEKPGEQERTAITAEELAANQINHKDLSVLPVFKNYHPGAPTSRLYIKNCAKSVITKDLEYIYNRYRIPDGNIPSQFDIRLMQEGRMKGQAFVTLDSIETAQKAVKETNGYILKDKPLVVVFARSAGVQKK